MDKNRRAGSVWLKVNGVLYEAKGEFTYNLGHPKREAIIGANGIHGYKETPQVAFIEGAIIDHIDLDLPALTKSHSLTVTLETQVGSGKTIVLSEAWYAGEGSVSTSESEIGVRFESKNPGEEMK